MPLLQVHGIKKRFPGVLALDAVDMAIEPGEVLAVIGENGAGKSTLMKILAGIQASDEGEILIDNKPVTIDSPRRATELGIALIHQELNLCDNLTVAANIYLGREPRTFGLIDREAIHQGATTALAQIGLNIAPNTLLRELPIGHQQLIEIAKALSTQARVLIMDEPTSSLTSEEAKALFTVINDLRDRGVAIVYISHRLSEVTALADRVTVLRDGQNAGELPRTEILHNAMVSLMVGRNLSQYYAHQPHEAGEIILQAEDLVVPAWPEHPLNFSVHRGEIVGIAGLVGAGRTELLQVLFGIAPALAGRVLIDGDPQTLHSPVDAIRAGLALVPEDRKQQGLILEMAVADNIGLPGDGTIDALDFGGFGRYRQIEGEGPVDKAAVNFTLAGAVDDFSPFDTGRHGRVDHFGARQNGDLWFRIAQGVRHINGVADNIHPGIDVGRHIDRAIGNQQHLVTSGNGHVKNVADASAGAQPGVPIDGGAHQGVGVHMAFHDALDRV